MFDKTRSNPSYLPVYMKVSIYIYIYIYIYLSNCMLKFQHLLQNQDSHIITAIIVPFQLYFIFYQNFNLDFLEICIPVVCKLPWTHSQNEHFWRSYWSCWLSIFHQKVSTCKSSYISNRISSELCTNDITIWK